MNNFPTRAYTSDPIPSRHRARPATVLVGALALAVVALLLALPGQSEAEAATFGANLKAEGIKAVKKPVKCPSGPAATCSWMPRYHVSQPYEKIGAAGDGVVRKIKLIARKPGTMKLLIGEAFDGYEDIENHPERVDYWGSVDRLGPTIRYRGTGKIEKFKVRIPVEKYDRIGFETKRAGTVACGKKTKEAAYIFEPPLRLDFPDFFQEASSLQNCAQMIQAKVNYQR